MTSPGKSRLRTAALSLATATIGAMALSTAALADDNYIWVRQSLPPFGAVSALDFPEHPLCRITLNEPGHPDDGTLWLGWYDGTDCRVENIPSEAQRELDFLMPAPGHLPYWVPLPAENLTAAPAEALVGGQRDGEDLVICSQDGVTGSLHWGTDPSGESADITRCAATPPWEEDTPGRIYIVTDIIVPIPE
jgi:hypothetical protein